MTPFWSDDHMTLYGGDCRAVLRELPAESVHCVVTSPPYWGLRDYGTARWEGGDEACDHVARRKPPTVGSSSTLGYPSDGGERRIGEGNQYHNAYTEQFREGCAKCGARRVDAQLGLEATPEAYVANMVEVFREVRRVLRDDGTLWLNLGDSYAGSWGAQGRSGQMADRSVISARQIENHPQKGSRTGSIDSALPIKPKDLVGIPWRVAFALQADGWYLRSDIIWAKPNPMPESVTDRPTKAHEYLFLLAKSPRYHFDGEAVRLPVSPHNHGVVSVAPHRDHVADEGHRKQERRTYAEIKGANIRTVWTIATEPYPGAHFATFPRKLVEPCVKAGCPADGVVLDPFAGSGTTLLVAQSLGRRAIGIDLNPEYLRQALARNAQAPLGLGAA